VSFVLRDSSANNRVGELLSNPFDNGNAKLLRRPQYVALKRKKVNSKSFDRQNPPMLAHSISESRHSLKTSDSKQERTERVLLGIHNHKIQANR